MESTPILPLTERVLAILPGSRWIWIILWSLISIPMSFLTLRLVEDLGGAQALSEPPSPWALAAYVNATFLTVWGAGKLVGELQQSEPAIARLTTGEGRNADRPIRGMDSLRGPLVLTLALVGLNGILVALEFGVGVALVAFPIDFLIELPLLTFFWVYASLLIGLNRLGGQKLRLEPTPGDRTLGLAPVGRLAFTGFWIFSLGFAPILIVTATSTATLVLNLAFFLIGVGLFLLSLNRLHQQMSEAKRGHLAIARRLYADAYAPLLDKPAVRTLRAQTPLLNAAESLEKRAASIQEWPFDEVLTGRITIIVSSVVATVIARIVLQALGL
jgi:hypothetical protein